MFFRGPRVSRLARPRAVGKGPTFLSSSVPLRRFEPHGATFPPSEGPLSGVPPFQLNLAPHRRVVFGVEGPHDGLIAGHIIPMYVFPSSLTRVQFVDRLASIRYGACKSSHLPGAQQRTGLRCVRGEQDGLCVRQNLCRPGRTLNLLRPCLLSSAPPTRNPSGHSLLGAGPCPSAPSATRGSGVSCDEERLRKFRSGFACSAGARRKIRKNVMLGSDNLHASPTGLVGMNVRTANGMPAIGHR